METAEVILENDGKEAVADFVMALAKYALHEQEPIEKTGPLKYLWPQLKEKIDASQEHRARGFSKEDIELTLRIRQYKKDHPNESQDRIAKAIGCSKGKVNSALKSTYAFDEDIESITSTNTSTNTTTAVTMTVTENIMESNDSRKQGESNSIATASDELISLTVLNNWKKGRSLGETADIVNHKLGTAIDTAYVNAVLDNYKTDSNYKSSLESSVQEQNRSRILREQNERHVGQVLSACAEQGVSATADEVMRYYDTCMGTSHSFTVSSLVDYIREQRWDEENSFQDVMKKWCADRDAEMQYEFAALDALFGCA